MVDYEYCDMVDGCSTNRRGYPHNLLSVRRVSTAHRVYKNGYRETLRSTTRHSHSERPDRLSIVVRMVGDGMDATYHHMILLPHLKVLYDLRTVLPKQYEPISKK